MIEFRPKLFNTKLVPAILAGRKRKTVTRKPVKELIIGAPGSGKSMVFTPLSNEEFEKLKRSCAKKEE